MRLFKILIPKENTQEVIELESWTVSWEILTGWSNNTKIHHKTFIKESDAEEFEKQLNECAKFTKAWISTKKYKN